MIKNLAGSAGLLRQTCDARDRGKRGGARSEMQELSSVQRDELAAPHVEHGAPPSARVRWASLPGASRVL
jgi:hypothetical protein